MSCHKSSQLTEPAIEIVRRVVGRLRGFDMVRAKHKAADILDTTSRRVRSLYDREPGRVVLFDEFYALRRRYAAYLRQEAARQRRLADADEHEADLIDLLDGEQLSLWGTEWQPESEGRCA